VRAAVLHFGKIDILVNGAAGNFLARFSEMSYNAYKAVIDIDTIGTFNVSKAVYELGMKGQTGVIINIVARISGGTYMQAHAGSAKAAVEALTLHLAVELGPQNVRVVGIAPGAIDGTEGFARLKDPEAEHLIRSFIPL
jgi:peroxisomal 2,4-dienoyl-CoA reductase